MLHAHTRSSSFTFHRSIGSPCACVENALLNDYVILCSFYSTLPSVYDMKSMPAMLLFPRAFPLRLHKYTHQYMSIVALSNRSTYTALSPRIRLFCAPRCACCVVEILQTSYVSCEAWSAEKKHTTSRLLSLPPPLWLCTPTFTSPLYLLSSRMRCLIWMHFS